MEYTESQENAALDRLAADIEAMPEDVARWLRIMEEESRGAALDLEVPDRFDPE
jgi:hypothetical protein